MSHSSFIHGSRQSPVVARSSAPASAPALVHFCEVRAMALADVRGARRSFFYSSGTRPAVVASSGAPVSGRAACDSATEALAGPRIRRRPGDGPAVRFGEIARAPTRAACPQCRHRQGSRTLREFHQITRWRGGMGGPGDCQRDPASRTLRHHLPCSVHSAVQATGQLCDDRSCRG